MHWILDVTMAEDACQVYKDHGAENLSCLRHISDLPKKQPGSLNPPGYFMSRSR